MSPPAIAIICNSLPPYRVHVHRRIVREMGHQVTLWTLCTHEISGNRWRFVAPEEIRPVSFGRGQSSSRQATLRYALPEWLKAARVIRWLRSHHIRAVVMAGYNDPGRLRILRWCKRNHIPLFLSADSNIHADPATGFKARLKRWLLTRIVRSCAGFLVFGQRGRDYFLKYGADPNRIFFHALQSDYDLIAQLPQQFLDQTRLRYGLDPHRRRLLYSGRLAHSKRPDMVIDAFAAIAPHRPEWDLVMVGDGELRAQLQRRVPPDLATRVLWTGFVEDPAIVGALYRLSDVLVLASEYEPWGLVVDEAAAAGMAIVSSSVVGAAADLVRDGENGRLFPPGDLPRLTECLLDVTQPDRIDTMKAASLAALDDWRRRGDPIQGLRQALATCGIL